MFTDPGERERDNMVTTLLVVWAIIGPSVGLAVGAWWCSRERDEPVRVTSRQALPSPERSLGWR
ncbi:hypothetical protein [Inquilinus limosus]|uniref:hypothetical protein n=1 Tax=Inquilinus limosus TaxID=171674 RepID=UPI00119829DF|nr:hypothetical protein [Inquilinus limosus]